MYYDIENFQLELVEFNARDILMATVAVGPENATVMVDIDLTDSMNRVDDLTVKEIKRLAFERTNEEVQEEELAEWANQ